MASRRSKGRRATSVVDTILGEAVSGTLQQRYNDMLHIASVIVNRAVQLGVPPSEVLTQKEFNAFNKALPKGVNQFRALAEQAWASVIQQGPVTAATFYATPKATKNLPKGLEAIGQTFGHNYFTDPKNRAIGTRRGYVKPGAVALPSRAPVPAARPAGLGAPQAIAERFAPAANAVAKAAPPRGFDFSAPQTAQRPQSPLSEAFQRDFAADTMSKMLAGANMPVSPAAVARTVAQAPSPRPATAAPAVAQRALAPSPSDIVSPAGSYASVTAAQRPATRSMVSPAAVAPAASPARMVSLPTPAARPAPAQPSLEQTRAAYKDYGLSRDLAPVTPVGQKPAPAVAMKAQTAAPPSVPAYHAMTTPMQKQPASPLGLVNKPVGPAQAPPAALSAAQKLGAAMAAAAPEYAQPARTVAEAPEVAVSREVAQPAARAARTTRAQTGGIPTGVAGPWGADIANQPPAVDRMTTSATAPIGFGERLTNFAQRYGPQIAGTMIAGPVGGFLGGILGRSFNAAKPGQLLGNPFQGLANTAKAMGMFQSAAPSYTGPRTTYGYGTRAIGDVLSGNAPVGATAYSRSQPGVSYTTMPSGMVEKVNQYGFRSFEKPSSFAGPGVFGGGFGWGGFGGGGGKGGGKSGGKSGGRGGGGAASTGAGHSKSSRF